MSFTAWMAAGGALLLTMALSSAFIKRLPVSTAAIYLGVGCAIGPWGFELLRIDLNDSAHWVERLTEIAVILSLCSSAVFACVCRCNTRLGEPHSGLRASS